MTLYSFLEGGLISACSTESRWHSIVLKASLIILCPMNNRLWVKTFWKEVLLHLALYGPTGSKWHCIFLTSSPSLHLLLWPIVCEYIANFLEWQPHWILSYDQQEVSHIGHFQKGGIIALCPISRVEWVAFFILLNGSLIETCPMTNRRWVYTRHFLSMAVWSHLVLWTTGSECQ